MILFKITLSIRRTFLFLIISTILASLPAVQSHPGDGIDQDSEGNIYITDVYRKAVWKIDSNRRVTKLLSDHWSHGLCVDTLNRIWVEVEVNNSHYSIVRIETDQSVTPVVGPIRRGQDLYGVTILADAQDNLYFPHSYPANLFGIGIRKRTSEGIVSLIAGGTKRGHRNGVGPDALFTGVQSMRFGPDNWIYLVDQNTIRKVSLDGQVKTLYQGITDPHPKNQPFDNGNPTVSNRIYGLDIEPGTENVVVAYHGNRSVLRFSETGRQVIYQSNKPWSPVGVLISGNGILIKETGLEPGSNQTGPRVIRHSSNGAIEKIVTIE